jgi:hypothetical protein
MKNSTVNWVDHHEWVDHHPQVGLAKFGYKVREETGKPAGAHLKTFRRHVGTYPLIFVLSIHTQFLSLKLSMCSFTLFHCPYQCGKKIHQICCRMV